MFRNLLQAVTIALLLISANSAQALVVPSGLFPGDTYQLAFVTAGARNATESNISTYNTFVQDEADLAGSLAAGAVWKVIGSTNDDDARDNAVVSAPVYLLDGLTKIADDFADMWDGDIDNPININQFGISIPAGLLEVYTGSTEGGVAADTFTVGSPQFLGSGTVNIRIGHANETSSQWISATAATSALSSRSFYALSQVFTVVPEPMSSSLLAIGALALLGRRRRR